MSQPEFQFASPALTILQIPCRSIVFWYALFFPLPNRPTQARDPALPQIGQLGPFVEGSLSPFKRPGCAQPGWHLTFKQQGRTRTLYVPMDLVAQVKAWTLNYRHLKKLIRQVTR